MARTVATPSIFLRKISPRPNQRSPGNDAAETTDPGQEPLDGFLIFSIRHPHGERPRSRGKRSSSISTRPWLPSCAATMPTSAALVLAVIAGVQIMRQLIGLAPLAS